MTRPRTQPPAPSPQPPLDLSTLDLIQRRVLWLATRMVHEANHLRPNPDRSKVGGHQASSASMVSALTALYFAWLRAGDRVAVKPHASPAFHAVQYLLGNLDRSYLRMLRQFGGLQAYPSRTKDPDPVDFSTGSVGLGVAATLFAALTDRYAELHFRAAHASDAPRRRFVALVGDAELDEGNVWEAVIDPTVQEAALGNVLWVVDLNRQSLDHVVPGVRAGQLKALFSSAGWQVLEAKYGTRLETLFAGPGGVALRRRLDDMPNEEYQAMVRLDGAEARARLIDGALPGVRPALATCVEAVPEARLPAVLGDLGGHDLAMLLDRFARADADQQRPTVLFAYTMKGWGLPIAGDPLNHSSLLTQAQVDALADELGVGEDPWAAFPIDSPQGRLCREAALRLYPPAEAESQALPVTDADLPNLLQVRVAPSTSSQEAFGNALVELDRLGGPLADRVVTASPDVAVSTNLGGWVNRAGVFATQPNEADFGATKRLLKWLPSPLGRHVEVGISEMNLFLLLGQMGLSRELNGDLLLPVGTVYDPFVCRGLDALIYGCYSGSKFVFAGTPAGVTLSPEGGAHQSAITVSIGMELPHLVLYEPCYARETEWCLLEGLRQCLDRDHGTSTYLRLSTKVIDQAPFDQALERYGENELRRQVLHGGYRLFEPPSSLSGAPRVVIAAAGPLIPEALEAAQDLLDEDVAASVLNLTGLDQLYASWRQSRLLAVRDGRALGPAGHFDVLIAPEERHAPIVAVLDAATHAAAFLGGAYGQPVIPLGVDVFGQSGARADLYAYAGIDAAHITNAALVALGLAPA